MLTLTLTLKSCNHWLRFLMQFVEVAHCFRSIHPSPWCRLIPKVCTSKYVHACHVPVVSDLRWCKLESSCCQIERLHLPPTISWPTGRHWQELIAMLDVVLCQPKSNLLTLLTHHLLTLPFRLGHWACLLSFRSTIFVAVLGTCSLHTSLSFSVCRIYSEERHTWLQDCDDDGETAAGSRMLHLMQVNQSCLECTRRLVACSDILWHLCRDTCMLVQWMHCNPRLWLPFVEIVRVVHGSYFTEQ